MMPGNANNRVRTILIQNCVVAPTCMNAATGGRRIARTILRTFIHPPLLEFIFQTRDDLRVCLFLAGRLRIMVQDILKLEIEIIHKRIGEYGL